MKLWKVGRSVLVILFVILLFACESNISSVVHNKSDSEIISTWFETSIPEDWYSYDPSVYDAFNAYAIQTPPGITYWKLQWSVDKIDWKTEKESMTELGLRAGHRWYVKDSVSITFRMIAWSMSNTGEIYVADTAYYTHFPH